MDARYEVSRPSVVADFVDGEVVAVNLDTGVYFAMFEGAALAWEALSRGASIREVAQRCVPTNGETTAALSSFATELVSHGLLRPGSTRDPECEGSLVALQGRAPLGPLVVHVHEDLQDMLLLDPVHDAGPAGWPESREE